MEVQTGDKDLIGRVIRKRFGKKRFSGVVDSFDAQYNWFKVVYEDGDEEDLERVEVEELLHPFKKSCAASMRKRRSPEGVTEQRARQLVKKKCLEKVPSAIPSAKHSNKDKIVEKGEGREKKKLGSKIESQGQRRAGSGITLQEGIRRYLEKCEDAGLTSVGTRVRQKAQSTETTSSKQKLSTFEITQTARSTTRKIIGKFTSGCGSKGVVEQGITLLSSSTLKKFGRHFYHGTVTSYDKETKLYMVQYENGYKEDLAWRDLEPTLLVCKKLAPTKPIMAKEKAAAVRLGAALRGTETRKKFGKKYYTGVVSSYDKKTQWYTVEYEDGDREDLELCELEPTLVQNWQGRTRSTKLSATKLMEDRDGNKHKLSYGLDGYPAKPKESDAKVKKRRDTGSRDYLIGSSVRKKFGRKFFDGAVINFDKKRKLYRVSLEFFLHEWFCVGACTLLREGEFDFLQVRYEDGDEEDLDWSKLKAIMILRPV